MTATSRAWSADWTNRGGAIAVAVDEGAEQHRPDHLQARHVEDIDSMSQRVQFARGRA